MALITLWTHGNALTVETPGDLESLSHRGWGTDLFVKEGSEPWFHIPIPTPTHTRDAFFQLVKVFLLFETPANSSSRIFEVHLFDGASDFQAFTELERSGSHLTGPDSANTFVLPSPHFMYNGLGLTFHFIPDHGIDSLVGPTLLSIAAAGCEFESVNIKNERSEKEIADLNR